MRPLGVSAAAFIMVEPNDSAIPEIPPPKKADVIFGVSITEKASIKFKMIAVKKVTSVSGLLISESAKLHKSAAKTPHTIL